MTSDSFLTGSGFIDFHAFEANFSSSGDCFYSYVCVHRRFRVCLTTDERRGLILNKHYLSELKNRFSLSVHLNLHTSTLQYVHIYMYVCTYTQVQVFATFPGFVFTGPSEF